MNRATAIICGLLLFGLGLFLGMVGSFVCTLPSETPRAPKMQARVKPPAVSPQRAAQPKPPAAKQPPQAVESALSQALAMVAVALAQQPATSAPPPAMTPVAIAPVDTTTNALEQHPLELLISDAPSETAQVEPSAPVPLPPPPPDPLVGHWVFDQRLGWLWLPENSRSVVVVPVIEVFPGGLITIRAGSKTAASKTAAAPPFQPRNGSVTQRDVPNGRQSAKTSSFPQKQ